jgi:lycopene cyclase domain-containing protein
MSYTGIALVAVCVALLFDAQITKRSLITSKRFWTSYAIILPFQLLTNWWLTSRNIVMYSPDAILGVRIASAPVEDLFFGFALIYSVIALWEFMNERQQQRRT